MRLWGFRNRAQTVDNLLVPNQAMRFATAPEHGIVYDDKTWCGMVQQGASHHSSVADAMFSPQNSQSNSVRDMTMKTLFYFWTCWRSTIPTDPTESFSGAPPHRPVSLPLVWSVPSTMSTLALGPSTLN